MLRRGQFIDRARAWRVNDTRAEAKLWQALRNRRLGGWKWQRQVAIGRYIVDFICVAAGVVVEVDGATHEDHVYDARRTRDLEAMGLAVLRMNNSGYSNTEMAFAMPSSPLAAGRPLTRPSHHKRGTRKC